MPSFASVHRHKVATLKHILTYFMVIHCWSLPLFAYGNQDCLSQLENASAQKHPHPNTASGSIAEDRSFFSQILPAGPKGPWLVRYRVFLPKGFDPHKKYGVVYFLHGRTGDRFVLDGLNIQEVFNAHVDRGENRFLIVTLDGESGYWMNAALKDERWSDVLIQELIPTIENQYPVIANANGRLLAGISMGAHGATQNALNHPEYFGAVAAHSPVFRTQEEALQDFPLQFGTGRAYQERDPFSLIIYLGKNLHAPFWMDIGARDFALRNTRNFAQLVRERKYNAELHIAEDQIGGHAREYWAYHLPQYLSWYGRHLPVPN